MKLDHLINTWLGGIKNIVAPVVQAPTVKPFVPDTGKIPQTLRYMESRGQKDPYDYTRQVGGKYGNALGAYQIRETTLKENAKRFLGKDITSQEFIKNPQLQDQFIEAEIKYLQDLGYKTNSLITAHHSGWGSPKTSDVKANNLKFQKYMNEAMKYYNTLK